MIKIIGLGPGDKNALTLGAIETLKSGEKIFLRTFKHPTVQYLDDLNIAYSTFDDKYENSKSFDEVYNSIAEELIISHSKYKQIVYAVPGHPLVAEKSVSILIEKCKNLNVEYDLLPAVSFVDAIMESLTIDPIEGIKIIDAFDINNQLLDKRSGVIITQVYNKFIASEIKLALLDYYKDDTKIYFIRAAGVKDLEIVREIPLYELDRQEEIDYLTSVYIPKDLNNNKDFYDLLEVMKTLRGESGCPWDREQTHESLKKYLLEESYEVIEAIENKNDDMLIEELGDVLLQVVFHAEIGNEEGFFNINDVIQSICNKMIDRHPHVFGEVDVENSDEVLYNWDKIKKKEKGFKTYTEEMKHIAKILPALIRAEKVQKKAAKVGFDWDKIEDAFEKVKEEFYEVKDVYKNNNREKILEEVGDLIFSVVNVARFLDIDPEFALNYTIDKFINRFNHIEQTAINKGLKLENMTLQEMDLLWEEAKTQK
ncbi:tetrapyrrole methylase family protein/MazG family protein [Clostridium pascui]|uniref:nucleoside triphosphate pyrophosphohydrolase n=1 Tax=Clostridium pascui TaxID=46609 RepID=UPI00195A7684|nr:nucleoside triphosphate pyrophosphohydrolase [Clostridium pascui]MBM7872000.1 tetrapyrrole methylase family protein/MazG family protein [Clostridium pascui]